MVTGDADVGRAFVALPFDHLRVHRLDRGRPRGDAQAAATNLTPVTLELGGKSPAVDRRPAIRWRRAAERIARRQAAQRRPDLHRARLRAGAARAASSASSRGAARRRERMYPTRPGANRDYTSIINERHYAPAARLPRRGAPRRGAPVVDAVRGAARDGIGAPAGSCRRRCCSTPPPTLRVMQEEIFGPVLPMRRATTTSTRRSRFVNARPTGRWRCTGSTATRRRARRGAGADASPAACRVNETLLHVAQEELPFGGVGAVGHGRTTTARCGLPTASAS
ncbi:MAG: aldehyde dehydrogenase family protein [Comamonadaceae bacterium]|nr:aldehyde dehydrogenase family protein [Comamonadaceae bacterium]